MGSRSVSLILVALLVLLQAQLWHGRGSLPQVAKLRRQIEEQVSRNVRAQFINDRLASEVNDLRQGLDTVEYKARLELGMVKPNEIFVQISK